MNEQELWEKLSRIDALFAGAATEGERAAAGADDLAVRVNWPDSSVPPANRGPPAPGRTPWLRAAHP